MEVRLTNHARKQLVERNLSEAEVIMAVRTSDATIKQSPHRFRAVKKVHKNSGSKPHLLVVIYDTRGARKEIVTAFLTSKIHKYL